MSDPDLPTFLDRRGKAEWPSLPVPADTAGSFGTALARYEAACRAIAEAKATDELLDIRDQADRLRAASIVANNRALEIDAAEIRIRAERRLGEMIDEQKRTVGLAKGGRPPSDAKTGLAENPVSDSPSKPISLREAGIDKNLANRARKVAAIPETQFARELRRWRERQEIDSARVSVSLARDTDKKARREAREKELTARILALPDKRYGVIYADPPWRFEPMSRDTGLDRSADNHYPCAGTEEIRGLAVDELAADDAALFLWATVPMLPDALLVMTAWGFAYRSHVIWKKVYPGNQKGTGYWFRNEHELLLVGARGKVPAPAPGTQWGSVINAPVGRHSEKPGQFRQLIETYYPSLPRIELFGRAAAEGWDVWGYEAPESTGGEP